MPFVIVNSLCGALVAYGLAGLRLTAHSLLINLVITALQSMISIQLQVCADALSNETSVRHENSGGACPGFSELKKPIS